MHYPAAVGNGKNEVIVSHKVKDQSKPMKRKITHTLPYAPASCTYTCPDISEFAWSPPDPPALPALAPAADTARANKRHKASEAEDCLHAADFMQPPPQQPQSVQGTAADLPVTSQAPPPASAGRFAEGTQADQSKSTVASSLSGGQPANDEGAAANLAAPGPGTSAGTAMVPTNTDGSAQLKIGTCSACKRENCEISQKDCNRCTERCVLAYRRLKNSVKRGPLRNLFGGKQRKYGTRLDEVLYKRAKEDPEFFESPAWLEGKLHDQLEALLQEPLGKFLSACPER